MVCGKLAWRQNWRGLVFSQLRQEDNIPVTASYLAAPELPLVATLQHPDLWAYVETVA